MLFPCNRIHAHTIGMQSLKRSPIFRLRRFVRKLTRGWRPYRETPVAKEDLDFAMRRGAIPSYGFLLLLSLSAFIATLGLILDSAPSIIGAMIIAPLMSPILSAAYGVSQADRALIILSGITIIIGTLLVLLLAFATVGLFGLRVAGSEILA